MGLEGSLINEGPGLTYLVRPSAGPDAGTRPVLFFLHGYDEGPPTNLRTGVARHGPLRSGNAVAALKQFIIVAPQLPQRGDLWHRFADALGKIAAEVHHAHHGDPQRTYLSGFSFGANGVFDVALDQPRLWAALWAVDPTRLPRAKLQQPVWLSFGEIARHRKQQFIEALGLHPCSPDDDRDAVFDDRGVDHVGSARIAYQDERIYSWLLSKRLASQTFTR